MTRVLVRGSRTSQCEAVDWVPLAAGAEAPQPARCLLQGGLATERCRLTAGGGGGCSELSDRVGSGFRPPAGLTNGWPVSLLFTLWASQEVFGL